MLARGYLGPPWNGWPFPRGVDRYEHAVMAGMMLSDGSNESFMLYPPGFHLLTAMISRLSGIEPLEIFPAPRPRAAPAVPPWPATRWRGGCGAGRTGWRPPYSRACSSAAPYLHFVEARYPNFIGE